jgi:hypothetical protein
MTAAAVSVLDFLEGGITMDMALLLVLQTVFGTKYSTLQYYCTKTRVMTVVS